MIERMQDRMIERKHERMVPCAVGGKNCRVLARYSGYNNYEQIGFSEKGALSVEI